MNEQQNRWDELAGELAGTDYAHAPESTQTAIDWIIKLESAKPFQFKPDGYRAP